VDAVEEIHTRIRYIRPDSIAGKRGYMAIITISREFGSRGKEIGHSLAEGLGYEYIDRGKIIDDMKALDKEWGKLGEEFDERRPNVWERYDWSFRGFVALTQSILLNYGLKDKVVLMGRGWNVLFKNVPYALRVRISMPIEARIARLMREEDLTRDNAYWMIEKADKEMTDIVHWVYGKGWDDPAEYDMRFDLGVQKEQDVIDLIKESLEKKEQLNTEETKKALRMQAIAADVKAGIATNRNFLIPTLDVKAAENAIVLRGIVHNPREKELIEKEAKRLAGDIPIEFGLQYRGLLHTKTE
jgi:cytidylate kinase